MKIALSAVGRTHIVNPNTLAMDGTVRMIGIRECDLSKTLCGMVISERGWTAYNNGTMAEVSCTRCAKLVKKYGIS